MTGPAAILFVILAVFGACAAQECTGIYADSLAHPTDCGRYYNLYLMTCPDGELYDTVTRRCVPAGQSACGQTTESTIPTEPISTSTWASTTGASTTGASTTAGSTTGASTTAGSTTGASTTVGSTTGASTTVGSTTGASTTAGSTTAGSTTGASTTVGSTTGASTTVGSTTGASTTAGSTTGASTTAGSTTGASTTVGSTTGASTTGASTTVGSTTGASTTVGSTTGASTTVAPTSDSTTSWPSVPTEGSTTPASSRFPCPAEDDPNVKVRYAHETDCNLYYLCVAGSPVLYRCTNDAHFAPTLKACRAPEVAACDRCPPTEVARLPHESVCSYYYRCEDGEPTLYACTDANHFSRGERLCTPPDEAWCTLESVVGSSTQTATTE